MIRYQSKNPYRNEDDTEVNTNIQNLGEDFAAPDKSNNIFLYEEISDKTVLKIRKQIDNKVLQHKKYVLENDLSNDLLTNHVHINLYINSYGGSASDAFNLSDYIKRCPIPIYTYVEGIAASGATIVSVSGKKRFMTYNSLLMIHQLSSWFGGKYEEFQDEKANLDLFMEMIKNIYLDNTKLSLRQLNTMLKKDIYLSYKKCLEYGFVDEMI